MQKNSRKIVTLKYVFVIILSETIISATIHFTITPPLPPTPFLAEVQRYFPSINLLTIYAPKQNVVI